MLAATGIRPAIPVCYRASSNERYKRLEPYDGKLSRTVLRGGNGGNAVPLPDWQHVNGKTGQPYSIGLRGGEPFAFAGIWTATKDEQDEWLVSCAILTTGPNELVARLHDRQPVILAPDQEQTWLDSDVTDATDLMPILVPLNTVVMELFGVPRLVNNVANEGPSLRERVPEALQDSLL